MRVFRVITSDDVLMNVDMKVPSQPRCVEAVLSERKKISV